MVFVRYKNINRWNNPKNMLFCVEKYNAKNFMGKNFLGDKLKYIHVPVYFINYFPRTHSHQVICFKFFSKSNI